MNKQSFITDLNIIDLPIFSASKKIKSKKQKETIEYEKNNKKIKLIVTYPENKLTFFDRKILGTIEYLYSKLYDFNKLKIEIDKEVDKKIIKYLERFKIKNESDLTLAEKQQIIYTVMEKLKNEYKVFLTLKKINDILDKNLYNHSNIKKSLIKLSQTMIHSESNYKLDNSNIDLNFTLLDVNIAESEKNKRQNIIISLNPFHFYNLLNNYIVKADLKLLNSFKQQIAGRLSELLNKALYGSKAFKKNTVVYDYHYICNYLQIEKRKSKSLILQQLKKPFNELIEKKIIVNWLLTKNLFDYEILFYHSNFFYEDYYNRLDENTKIKIQKGLAKLMTNDHQYSAFEKKVDTYFQNTNFKSKSEFETVKSFYSKHLFFNEFMDKK